MKPITILYGTETGNSEDCSEELSDELKADGVECRVIDMEDYDTSELVSEEFIIIITSTHGDGDAPENATAFLEYLTDERPSLTGVRFAVCGLGDTSYRYFCQTGKEFDEVLEDLGAERGIERVDCDDPPETYFSEFSQNIRKYFNVVSGDRLKSA
jgi:sulfite reductase (NADPH) flavoprotein alpha-component